MQTIGMCSDGPMTRQRRTYINSAATCQGFSEFDFVKRWTLVDAKTYLLRRTLTIQEKSLGPKHLSIAPHSFHSGAALRDSGRVQDAEPVEARLQGILASESSPVKGTVQ
jgi:hypothetical protein